MSPDDYINKARGKTVKRRPGFTLRNALRFKGAFDLALDNYYNKDLINKDILLEFSMAPTLNPVTFQQRASEALRWIIDYYDRIPPEFLGKYTAKDYGLLRGICRMRLTDAGVQINFPGGQLVGVINLAEKTDKVSWKSKLIDYIDHGEDGRVFNLTNLYLSDEDIDWVKNYLSSLPGIEMKISQDSIVIIK